MAVLNRQHFTLAQIGSVTLCVALLFISSVASRAAEHTIEIRSFKFIPQVLKVRPGDKITWINRDIAPHTATADDETWDTQELVKDQSFTMVVTAGMKRKYFCRFHPHMIAELIIER